MTHVATSGHASPEPASKGASSGTPPAMYNAYQLEPVLYMTPDDIKSSAQYTSKGNQNSLGQNVKVESYPGEVAPLVVSNSHQQYESMPTHYGQGSYQLENSPQGHSLGQYEAVQQVSPSGATHSDGITQLSSHGELQQQQQQQHLYGEPMQYEYQGPPPPPPPVTLLADASLLDTYMKYASLSTQDVLLPVYQQTQHHPQQHQQQIITSYVSDQQQQPHQQQTYQIQASPEEHTSGRSYSQHLSSPEGAYAVPFNEAALLHQDLQRITPIASAHPESGKAY